MVKSVGNTPSVTPSQTTTTEPVKGPDKTSESPSPAQQTSQTSSFARQSQEPQITQLPGPPASQPSLSREAPALQNQAQQRQQNAQLAAPVTSTTAPERPALEPLTISGSVGRGGRNRPADVRQVQQAMQSLGYLPPGPISGRIDQATMEAISEYQRENDLPVVDGRIDVNMYTMKDINRRAAQNTTDPSPTQTRPRPAPRSSQPVQPAPTEPVNPHGPAPSPSEPAPPTPTEPAPPTPTGPTEPNRPVEPHNPPPADPTQPAPAPQDPAPVRGVTPVAPASGPADAQLQALQQRSVESARHEWQQGVRERGRSNRSDRVDEYARTAGMNPGGEWCGYFTGFNYAQNGFQHSSSLASYQKARDFFMYRSYTRRTGDPANDRNDEIRAQHQADGSSRQYFMLEESPNRERITRPGPWGSQRYGHHDADANTFNYQTLPVRSGDTVLFHRGHVGMVESYDPATGRLVTLEGNTTGEGPDGQRRSGAVVRKEYDLSDPTVREQFDGFGRPSLYDFQ